MRRRNVKKKDIYFPYNTFVSYIFNKETFFQGHIEMVLKIIFITFEGFFEW